MLRVHPLRAADASWHESVAIGASHDPLGFEMVCLDDRSAQAAQKEGLHVLS